MAWAVWYVEDSITVTLECLSNCNGRPGIDLRHHLCLSSYLRMFSNVVLGQEKGGGMDRGGRPEEVDGRGRGKRRARDGVPFVPKLT